jgi:hypothetical protein
MTEREMPEICTKFYLTADEADLDEITEVLGLKPTSAKKKDVWPLGSKNAGLACDLWHVESFRGFSTSVDDNFEVMINLLKGKEEAIKHLVKKYDMRASFTVVIYADATAMPDLSLGKKSLRLVADLGADISIDPYIF